MTERQPAGTPSDPWLGNAPANVLVFPSRNDQQLPQVAALLEDVRALLRQNAAQLHQANEQLRRNADELRRNADQLHQIDLAIMGLHLVELPTQSLPTDALTSREVEILRLVATGHTNREIGQQLIVATGTVSNHLTSILSKLQASNRAEAVAKARLFGII